MDTKPEAKNYGPSLQSCLMSNTVRIDSLFLHYLLITLAFVLIFQLTHKVQTDAFRLILLFFSLANLAYSFPILLVYRHYYFNIFFLSLIILTTFKKYLLHRNFFIPHYKYFVLFYLFHVYKFFACMLCLCTE